MQALRPGFWTLLLASLCAGAAVVSAADERSFATWTEYLGGADSAQYSSLKQINKSNVKQLEVAWTFPVAGRGAIVFDPVVVDGVMYVLGDSNSVVALEAATGKQLWVHPNMGAVGVARHELLGKAKTVPTAACST